MLDADNHLADTATLLTVVENKQPLARPDTVIVPPLSFRSQVSALAYYRDRLENRDLTAKQVAEIMKA